MLKMNSTSPRSKSSAIFVLRSKTHLTKVPSQELEDTSQVSGAKVTFYCIKIKCSTPRSQNEITAP